MTTYDFEETFDSPQLYDLIFGTFRGGGWLKYASNPVMINGGAGTWDSLGLRDPMMMIDTSGNMVIEGGEMIMYYSGYKTNAPHYLRAIGRATSADGITWVKDVGNPILDKGAGGEWDDFGVQSCNVVKIGVGDYIMCYSGVNVAWTSWGIGIATSVDGITWTKHAGNPVLDFSDFDITTNFICTFPYMIKLSTGTWAMMLSGTKGVDRFNTYAATSPDALVWTPLNAGNTVMEPSGITGDWEEDVIEHPVFYEIAPNQYAMIYHGCNITTRGYSHSIGWAYSTDLITWTRYSDNPVLIPSPEAIKWDYFRVECGFVPKEDLLGGGTLRMWYNGTQTGDGELNSFFGYATCYQDIGPGVSWTGWDNTLIPDPYRWLADEAGNIVAALLGKESHALLMKADTGNFPDFDLYFRIKIPDNDQTKVIPAVNFRYTDKNNTYLLEFRGAANNDIYLGRYTAGVAVNTSYAYSWLANTWYSIRLRVIGNIIKVWVNNTLIVNKTDTGTTILSGTFGIYNFRSASFAYFDEIYLIVDQISGSVSGDDAAYYVVVGGDASA